MGLSDRVVGAPQAPVTSTPVVVESDRRFADAERPSSLAQDQAREQPAPEGRRVSDRLEALQRRGEELEAFADVQRQATKWIAERGTQSVVDELRAAREGRRRARLGAISCLVLLAHIDRLEAELAHEPLVKP